jgi:NAD+ kinase
MHLGIFGNPKKAQFHDLLPDLVAYLNARSCGTCLVAEVLSPPLRKVLEDTCIADLLDVAAKADLFLSFGGDGTMLHLIRALGKMQKPILGINLGRLGFLTEVQMDGLYKAIDALLQGNYSVETRMMLQAREANSASVEMALNDVVISKQSEAKLISISITVGSSFLNRFIADGVIISTPTGSTAYNLSSGGPVILPGSQSMVITPICPHLLSIRSVVVPAESTITIKVETDQDAVLTSFDGSPPRPLSSGSGIELSRAALEAQLVRLANYDFARTLRTKLLWSEDLRDRQKFDI